MADQKNVFPNRQTPLSGRDLMENFKAMERAITSIPTVTPSGTLTFESESISLQAEENLFANSENFAQFGGEVSTQIIGGNIEVLADTNLSLTAGAGDIAISALAGSLHFAHTTAAASGVPATEAGIHAALLALGIFQP